ncbi:MAG TPA: hypothetical protein VKB51_14160 [bacterium]|nr:hypothetical protein [bacterium]
MRTIVIAVCAMLALAGSAAAQVAAPMLNPTPVFTLDPGNPAVLSWDMPSRVGASWAKVEFTDPASPVNPIAKGNVKQAEAQIVGAHAAAGARLSKLNADLTGGGSLDLDYSTVQAALHFGNWFSLGAGQDSEKNTDPTGTNKETLPHLGATVRLADVLYLGVAGGKATISRSGNPDLKRNTTRYGVAYLWRDKGDGLHAEVFHEKRDAVSTPTNEDEQVKNGGTLEFKVGGFLVGYTTNKTEFTSSTGVSGGSQTLKTYSLAWAPDQGLAVSLSHMAFKANGSSGGPPEGKITTLGASWLF